MTRRVVNLISLVHCIIPGIRQAGKVAGTASQVIASPFREAGRWYEWRGKLPRRQTAREEPGRSLTLALRF
jgi:hypothetical protein